MVNIIPSIKNVVLILPDFIAATTFPLLPAIILIVSTTVSLKTIITVIAGDTIPCAVKIIKLELTSILSAIASVILPKSVTILRLLAIWPSIASVIDAIANNPAAIKYLISTVIVPINTFGNSMFTM